MSKKLINEEINRINTIFTKLNIPTKKLVLEAPSLPINLTTVAKSIENFFDTGRVRSIVEREVEKLGLINTSMSLEQRLDRWIAASMTTPIGQTNVRNLIKSVSQESREYTEYFIREAETVFEALENQKGIEEALDIIEQSFGKTIRDAYQRISGAGSIEKVIKNINASRSREKILTIWVKYLSGSGWVADGLKNIINIYSKSLKRNSKTLEKYIEELFDSISPAVKIVQNYGQLDSLSNASTIFTETNAMIHGLTLKARNHVQVNHEQVYRAIKQKLMQPIATGGFGLELRQADVIIDGLKKDNPFIQDYYKSGKKHKLWQFLDETTSMDILRYMGNSEKTLFNRFLEGVKRMHMIGLYGNIKYLKDWQYFIDTYGTKRGSLVAYGYLQVSAHLILPFYIGAFTGMYRTFTSLFKHLSEEERKSLGDQIVEAWGEAYSEAFTPPEGSAFDKSVWGFQQIVPFHFMYWKWKEHIGGLFTTDVGGEVPKLIEETEETIEERTKIDRNQMSPEDCLSKYPCLGENGGKVIRNSLNFNMWVNPDTNASIKQYALISYKETLRIVIPNQGEIYLNCATFNNLIPKTGETTTVTPEEDGTTVTVPDGEGTPVTVPDGA